MTLCSFLFLMLISIVAWCDSKRVEVYQISQQYWDVKAGDTLSSIAEKLLPHNPNMQLRLIDDIVRLNSKAFSGKNKHRILADTKLWLPSSMTRADTKVDKDNYTVRTFSWGNIKTPKR